jgi:hypothetical protein
MELKERFRRILFVKSARLPAVGAYLLLGAKPVRLVSSPSIPAVSQTGSFTWRRCAYTETTRVSSWVRNLPFKLPRLIGYSRLIT